MNILECSSQYRMVREVFGKPRFIQSSRLLFYSRVIASRVFKYCGCMLPLDLADMAFTKICSQCGSEQHCRRSVCEKCGFEWLGKAFKKVNKSEQEIELHRERNRVYQTRKRARESELETVQRRASVRQCKAKKRESMTEQEHVEHEANEKQYQARKRARESEH